VLVEQRGVFPDVLVSGTDQEPRPRRQREEVCHLWAPGNQVRRVPRQKEVGVLAEVARPHVPT